MSWLEAPDYWLTRLVLQRAIGLIYLVAFIVAARQFLPLLGSRGLLPVPDFVAAVPFRRSPSLFHLRYSDRLALAVAWAGAGLAAIAVAGLPDGWPLPLTMLLWTGLWALYLSIVNVGQTFYGFGWETLLLEAGFLAIFLGPAWTAPPLPLIWLLRWLLFRVEFGAGLIKLRGDRCWRNLTCLYYHHETQPMPNPLSWYFHHLPRAVHRAEVLGNHVAQLVVPFFLFAPQPVATLAGLVIVVTQSWLLLSGNFSWLNLITIALAISAFDDAALTRLLTVQAPAFEASAAHAVLVAGVTILVLLLSYRPARNLVSRRQLMNSSFDPLHLVNAYGAFGSVTKKRYEVVIEGTGDAALGPQTAWREYTFIGKPGDVTRRPPQIAPYHLRLDWLMWFAAFSSPLDQEWFGPLLAKLLEEDRATLRLLAANPFPAGPPRFVRARLYLYRFTTPAERRETGAWWHRTFVREYVPPIALRTDDRRR
ncbi:MAG TPA: lipase maturation factor family protein [Candidatus Limnocylindria bacterium]|nr:lipase maturation factor family protein [Candidatus Limnocylindria bacterium]